MKFIENSAQSGTPFFLYYGSRGGHNPFNTPLSYRNKSEAGVVGEAVMQIDDIIGKTFEVLEKNKIDDDTLGSQYKI